MTRTERTWAGIALILAIGCASSRCIQQKPAPDPVTEGPVSGDSGPAPIIEERHPPGPGEGNGVRKVP